MSDWCSVPGVGFAGATGLGEARRGPSRPLSIDWSPRREERVADPDQDHEQHQAGDQTPANEPLLDVEKGLARHVRELVSHPRSLDHGPYLLGVGLLVSRSRAAA